MGVRGQRQDSLADGLHGEIIALRERAARDHLAIDSAIAVPDAPHQDVRDRQVAQTGRGIDLRRGAALDALRHLEAHARAGPEHLPRKVELPKRLQTLDVEVTAEAQREG